MFELFDSESLAKLVLGQIIVEILARSFHVPLLKLLESYTPWLLKTKYHENHFVKI